MIRKLLPLIGAFLLVFASACGDDPDSTQLPAGCIPGKSEACACSNGRMGSQICTVGRTFTTCVCQDDPGMNGADAGTNPDTGPAGFPDAAEPPARTLGTEGYPCEKDPISGAEQCDTGLECFLMSSTSETDDPISICVQRCEEDDECAGSEIGNTLCREIRFGREACVAGEVDEGETANLSMLRGGPMTGCANDRSAGDAYLVGISYWVGSGLWSLEHDQSSCVRKCNIDDASDCTEKFPYCNAPFFNDGDGACSTGYKRAGAQCSRQNGTDMCSNDDDYDGSLVCWDYLGSHEDPSIGQCVQLCSISSQDCKTTHDSTLSPSCLDMGVSSTNPDRGMCSDECSRYPDTCNGTGELGVGQNCSYGFLRSSTVSTIDNPDIAFCWDIQPPVLGLWENGNTFDNCYTNRFSCPNGAHCETNGFQGPRGGCFVGCTTATTSSTTMGKTGCETVFVGTASIATTCEKARDPEFNAGRCMPVQ